MVWGGVAVPRRHLWPAPTTEVRLIRFQGRKLWPTGPTWGLVWIGAPGQDGIGGLGGALRKFWGIPIQNAVPFEAKGLGQGTSYLDLIDIFYLYHWILFTKTYRSSKKLGSTLSQ